MEETRATSESQYKTLWGVCVGLILELYERYSQDMGGQLKEPCYIERRACFTPLGVAKCFKLVYIFKKQQQNNSSHW